MGNNLAATCPKLIKWIRSNQVSHLLHNLCYFTNTKIIFFYWKLRPVETEDSPWIQYVYGKRTSKPQKWGKSHDPSHLFKKVIGTFNLCQWTQTLTKFGLWQVDTCYKEKTE